MDFKYDYSNYHKLKLNCNIKSFFKIKQLLSGSGGSSNIIVDAKTKDNQNVIIKIIPSHIYFNVKTRPDYDKLEIKFYQFLTKKYILTDKTPHIVGIYNHQHCSRIDVLIKNIRPSKKKCPSHEDRLTKKIEYDKIDFLLCDLMLRYEMKLLDPAFDIIMLEYCPMELGSIIEGYMEVISKANGKNVNSLIDNFIYDLDRIFFQIIFTLAIIKDDYPGFLHGDFFVRNILLSIEKSYEELDYVAYYFKQKIFYLPANGLYSKINDFGMTVIENELEPSTYSFDKKFDKFYHKNPFNKKTDIFNFLHDIYDGQNLGTSSIMKLAADHKIKKPRLSQIQNFLGRFIKINVIDRINTNNHDLLNQTWNINQIEVLENIVKTPEQYLMQNFFEHFQKLPSGSNIIRHFNAPNLSVY